MEVNSGVMLIYTTWACKGQDWFKNNTRTEMRIKIKTSIFTVKSFFSPMESPSLGTAF